MITMSFMVQYLNFPGALSCLSIIIASQGDLSAIVLIKPKDQLYVVDRLPANKILIIIVINKYNVVIKSFKKQFL